MSDRQDTDLGLLPKDWDLVTLGDLLYIKGRIGWKGLKKSEYLSEGYAIINGEQIKSDEVDWDNVGRVPKERYDESPEIMLKKDDILMTKDGTIGKIAYIEELVEPATVASGVFVIRQASEKLNQRFLYNYFSSHFFKWLIKSRVEGSVIPHLYQRDFQEMLIPLPSIKEQESIAEILLNISKKIKILHQQNHDLEELAQTLFKRWFVEFEFPNENGAPYLSSGGKMVESELGEIPEGWRVVKLQDIAEVGSSKRIFANEYLQDGVPFYRGKEVTELSKGKNLIPEIYISEEKFNELKSISGVPKPNDILLTSVGTIGNTYLVQENERFYFKDGNLTWFKSYKTYIDSTFIYIWLNSKYASAAIEGIKIGSTQQAITIASLNTIELLIPNERTYLKLKDSLKSSISKRQTNSREIQTLTQLRSVLLPKLMSGELRVKA